MTKSPGIVGADVAVRSCAQKGPYGVGQAEAEGVAPRCVDELDQVGGGAFPLADLRPVGAAVQFVGEGGQRHDFARLSSLGEKVVDTDAVALGGRPREVAPSVGS